MLGWLMSCVASGVFCGGCSGALMLMDRKLINGKCENGCFRQGSKEALLLKGFHCERQDVNQNAW